MLRHQSNCHISAGLGTGAPIRALLAIGIEPSFVDFRAFPHLTPEPISQFIEAQIERLRALGYEAESWPIGLGETAETVTTAALRSNRPDCVVIGAGLREPAE